MPGSGDTFERYRLESLLGEGGMGQVFRAFDPKLRRRVAIKLLSVKRHEAPARSRGPTPADRLLREARAAAALRHPNIVAVYDVGEHEGEPYIVMEYVEGTSLRDLLTQGALSLGKKLRIVLEVADALACAHASGVIHRDIKPDNVLVRPDGSTQVLDFGVAKQREMQGTPTDEGPSTPSTVDGHLVGTPQYMAPEQLYGEKIDERSDQFAWAVTAYEVLSGKSPWKTVPETTSIIQAICKHTPKPLGEVCPEAPLAVQAIIWKALAKAPEQRYAAMTEIVDALRAEVQALDSAATRSAVSSSPPPAPGSPTHTHPEPTLATRPVRVPRRPWGWLVLCAACLAGAGLMARILLSKPRAATTIAAAVPTEWPNDTSRANSDPWLVAHHDSIRAMHPRVLVVNFVNARHAATLRSFVDQVIDGVREGSRYHGYEDPKAPPFLFYEVAKMVDVIDDVSVPGWTHANSSRTPIKRRGATSDDDTFDYGALFGPELARAYGYEDAERPGTFLDLCALFERGIVHEVWVSVVPEELRGPVGDLYFHDRRQDRGWGWGQRSNRQRYDARGVAIPGQFDTCGGGGCFDPEEKPQCRVTVRVGVLVSDHGPGCMLEAGAYAIDNMAGSIPYFDENFRHFANKDFHERFGVPFDRWGQLCHDTSAKDPCVTYAAPNEAQWQAGTLKGRFAPLDQGCGDINYPPNARFPSDFDEATPVLARCATFGVPGAPPETVSSATWSASAAKAPGCGGAWQIYWRQSFPGLDNHAIGADGKPMKNWWPFLFY